jgi:sigma-B regulation protein RsbU (phosphoserine phosphatase)
MSAPARILVVDDTPNNVTLLEDMLTTRGYEVATARDGVEALEKVASGAPDLVLLDIMMPRMNGYEVLEHLKADGRLRDLPVIMISALDEIESVIRCVELGAEDYLPKPFNPTLLRARVGASLEKKRLRDEVRASLHRLEQELEAARKLQLGMLPGTFPAWSAHQPVRIYALMDPAREVGGDLYDFFDAGDGMFCFLVGDVSGKGAPAAMFMARTQSLVRMAVQLWRRTGGADVSHAGIAEAVNQELYQNNPDRMFVTMFLGFLDTKTGVLAYVNAGHPPPHLLHGSTEIEQITGKPETPLAVRPGSQYQTRTVMLRPGDALFVCSDGVIEAMSASEEFYGNERLEADLRAACNGTPEELVRVVKAHVDAFTGQAPKADDVTILMLRWEPALSPQTTTRIPKK